MEERPSIRRSFVDGAPAGARSSLVALANVGSCPRSSAISVAGSTDGKPFLEELAEIPDTLRVGTSFEMDVVSELEQNNPEVLTWLRSVSGAAFQLGLICFYILMDATKALILSAAMRKGGKPIGAVIIGMNSFISVLIGLGLVVITGQMDGGAGAAQAIKNAFNAKQIMAFSGVAFLFTLASIFNVMCYQYIDASVAKILSQLRLPLTALIGTVIVGKKYSMNHWMALIILTASAYSFFDGDQHHNSVNAQRRACFYPREFYEPLSQEESWIFNNCTDTNHAVPAPWTPAPPRKGENPMLGVTFILTSTLLNVLGSLLSERFMKASHNTPFYVQKLQMELTGTPVAIISSFVMPLMPLFLSGAYWSELPTALPHPGETLAAKVRGPSVEAAKAKMLEIAVKQLDLAGPKAMIWWKHQGDVNLTYSLTTRVNGTDQTLTGQSEVLSVGGKGPFMNWTELVIIALIVDVFLAWMGGIIVKRFSSVVKIICKALALVCTVIGNDLFLQDRAAESLPLQLYTVALVIVCDTILFSTLKDDKKPDVHGAHEATTEAAPEAREIQLAATPRSSTRV